MSFYQTCIICMNRVLLMDIPRACYSYECDNGICSECCLLTDRLETIEEDELVLCSTTCLIEALRTSYKNSIISNEYNRIINNLFDVVDKRVINDQEEIYDDIMSKNRYKHIVEIYPNVLAKLISEY